MTAVVALLDPVTPTSSTILFVHPMYVFPTVRDLSTFPMRPTLSTSFRVAPMHSFANHVHFSNRLPTFSTSFRVAPMHCFAKDVHLSNRPHHHARAMLSMIVSSFVSAKELVSLQLSLTIYSLTASTCPSV